MREVVQLSPAALSRIWEGEDPPSSATPSRNWSFATGDLEPRLSPSGESSQPRPHLALSQGEGSQPHYPPLSPGALQMEDSPDPMGEMIPTAALDAAELPGSMEVVQTLPEEPSAARSSAELIRSSPPSPAGDTRDGEGPAVQGGSDVHVVHTADDKGHQHEVQHEVQHEIQHEVRHDGSAGYQASRLSLDHQGGPPPPLGVDGQSGGNGPSPLAEGRVELDTPEVSAGEGLAIGSEVPESACEPGRSQRMVSWANRQKASLSSESDAMRCILFALHWVFDTRYQ